MGKLITGDKVKKKTKKKNNKPIIILIITLLLFSYYEIKSDLRIGGLLRDFLFRKYDRYNYEEVYKLFNEEVKKENDELKQLLDIPFSLTDFTLINASVIRRNSVYWMEEITINKGKNDGIEKNQIVINKNGMIGKVINSSRDTSIIRLITSFKEPISVIINDSFKLLDVENYNLYIKGINKQDTINVGDQVLTSGLSDLFPKGILIGTIEEIIEENDGVGYTAKVKLSSDINDIKFVSVLKRFK